MTLRDLLLKEHTIANCDRITKWVGDDQQRFDELWNYETAAFKARARKILKEL